MKNNHHVASTVGQVLRVQVPSMCDEMWALALKIQVDLICNRPMLHGSSEHLVLIHSEKVVEVL